MQITVAYTKVLHEKYKYSSSPLSLLSVAYCTSTKENVGIAIFFKIYFFHRAVLFFLLCTGEDTSSTLFLRRAFIYVNNNYFLNEG